MVNVNYLRRKDMNDIELIKAEIERMHQEAVLAACGNDTDWLRSRIATCVDILAFIDSLPDEASYDTQNYAPTPSVSIDDVARVQFASHAHVFDRKRKAVFDWEQFKEVAGIFYGFGKRDSLPEDDPLNDPKFNDGFDAGRAVQRIFDGTDEDSLPEEPLIPSNSVGLEEEIDNYFEGLWPGTETAEQCNTDLHFTPPAIMRLARHFAEWGAKCKDSLQVQETCKENQDSFTDEPKEMSVEEAMAYLEEKIAKASKSWEGVDVDKFLDEIRGREPNDLEEAADKYSEKHGFRVPYDGSNNFYDAVDVKASKEGFIAGAEWMRSRTPMPEDTVIFMKGVAEGRRLEREDRNDENLPRYYGD